MKKAFLLIAIALLTMFSALSMRAQDIPAAIGPGSYVAAGVGASAYQVAYGQRIDGGYTVFVDAHMTWRYGVEAEARSLRFHADEDVTQRTYLIGPHVYVWKPGRMRPYVKFLVGQGHMVYPFKYATGNFFAMAPGGGLDFMLNNVVSIRVVDLEYQDWRNFTDGGPHPTYSSLHPYGVSAGITIRLNPMKFFPRKARPDYKLSKR